MSRPRHEARSGSALVTALLLVGLMLTLVLFYVSLLRLDAQLSGQTTGEAFSRAALDRALAEAAAELAGAFPEGRAYLIPTSSVAWRSQTGASPVGDILPETLAEDLGWPLVLQGTGAESLQDRLSAATWTVEGATTGLHTATAWVAVNLTGLLDPHGVEGWDTGVLGFVRTPADPARYLTAREFRRAVPASTPVFLPGGGSRDRGWFDFTTAAWNTTVVVGGQTVGMDPRVWPDAGVDAVFAELYPDRDHDAMATAFRDFRSGATVPSDPLGITAVPVPMVNEVYAELTVRNTGDQVVVEHDLALELWRPFPGNPDTNRYEVARTPALVARNAASEPLELLAVDASDEWIFPAPGGGVDSAFAVLQLQVTQQVAVVEGTPIALQWEFAGMEVEVLDGDPVDELPGELRLELATLSVPASGQVAEVSATLAVTDPRLNHDLDQWQISTAPSLGGINPEAEAAQAADPLSDDVACWTPAGEGDTWEEGWIGFLPLDAPWRSVDLFAAEGQWWLRHTRPPGWVAGEWRTDRLNPNSEFPDAVAAVFRGVMAPAWPRQSGAGSVSPDLAERLALDVVANLALDLGSSQRGDWTTGLDATLVGQEGLTRQQAEGVMAESLERLSTTPHVWGVVAVAETRDAAGGARNRQGTVQVWWMDPYPLSLDGARSWQILSHHPFRLGP